MASIFPKPGEIFGDRYEIRGLIGQGAFGMVYRAIDRQGHRDVAIKTLAPKAFDEPELVARFHREAEICRQLQHANVASLHDFGEQVRQPGARPQPYMAFELVRGLPLGGLCDLRGRLRAHEVAYLMAEILDAIHSAHVLGIVHRDLKPNNVLVAAPRDRWVPPAESPKLTVRLGIPSPDDPLWQNLEGLPTKVVDFGLGKMLSLDGRRRLQQLTRAGVAAGTAQYMAPEQVIAAQDLDHRADIYGCAMLMYRLWTGRRPIDSDDLLTVAKAQVHGPIPALPEDLASHPIAAIYRKAAEKERDQRYGAASAMAWELRCVLDPAHRRTKRPSEDALMARARRGLFARLFRR